MNNDRTQPGHLHLTLSLLVEHRALEAAFGEQWSIERRRAILDDYQDTRALADAIEPLFSDVADRKRHLFIDDFLVDTPNRERTKGAGTAPANSTSGNLNDEVVIVFPRRIRWKTEGDDFSLEFGHELRLAANCRMFWFVHSNGSLSYHVSIDLEYRHHHQHYFALSALQKLIYPTEDTRELARGKLPEDSPPNAAHYDAVRVESHENGYRFWDYVERKFEAHLADLLETLKLTERARGQGLYASQFWQKLLLERRLAEYVEAGGDPRRADELPERRLVVLLRDPYFFQLLQAEARAKLTGFEGCFGGRTRDDRSYEISTTDLELIGAHALDYYFLSGYFQNIIDFLRQDTSEVKDGTDPIYPVTGQGDQTSHFVIYASSTSIFEVVSSSRSLEAAHDYIGTCPYLFLVHIMSFHNEVLVRAFERDVGKLVRAMERRGLTPERFKSIRAVQAREVLDEFQRYKLTLFHETKKHTYFNIFRYDTERAFYDEVEKVRGTKPRSAYWEEILDRLAQTVADVRDAARNDDGERLNRLVSAVALLGAFQFVFAVASIKKECTQEHPCSGILELLPNADVINSDGLILLLLGTLGAIVWFGWRRRT